MSDTEMSREQWRDFLRAPVRPALLATTRADGRPHVAPIWYDLDDDGTGEVVLVFNTGSGTVKGRNLRRTAQAALCVQDDQPPFSFVTVTGPVTWSDEVPEVRRWAGRIGGRYMGPDRAEEMADRNGVPGELVVWLWPDRVVGYADLAD